MEKRVVFVSDIHLGCSPQGAVASREKILQKEMRSWQQNASHVFLLGDVFEFWMEYRDFVPKESFWFLCELQALVESGVEVHYVPGNHDFNLGSFFQKHLGLQVHKHDVSIELQGKKLYLLHGDGIAASDWKYRIVKKIIKHPISNFLFKLLHPDWGMALARFVGQTSRDSADYDDTPLQEYEDAAWSLLLEHKADIVIHGHTHTPFVKTSSQGVYANSGQWLFACSYLSLEDGNLTLQKPVL